MIALITSVLVASLVGSLHCAAMCGPLAAFYSAGSAAPRPKLGAAHGAYHATRFTAYASLGLAAGAMGSGIDMAGARAGLASLAAAIAFAVLVIWGATLVLERTRSAFRRFRLPSRLEHIFRKIARDALSKPPVARAAVLGAASALLPCGWLYAFVLVAAGSGSAGRGLAIMGAFWLGTVPALVCVSAGARALATRFARQLPIASAICIVAVGVTGVVTRMRLPIHDARSDHGLSAGTPQPSDICHGR